MGVQRGGAGPRSRRTAGVAALDKAAIGDRTDLAPGAVEGGRIGWPEYEGAPFISGLPSHLGRKEDPLVRGGLAVLVEEVGISGQPVVHSSQLATPPIRITPQKLAHGGVSLEARHFLTQRALLTAEQRERADLN